MVTVVLNGSLLNSMSTHAHGHGRMLSQLYCAVSSGFRFINMTLATFTRSSNAKHSMTCKTPFHRVAVQDTLHHSRSHSSAAVQFRRTCGSVEP
eukprot:5709802-Amphidinium_carterae.1